MDRIDAMRAFARIVERKSFTRAVADLGVPRARLSETVQQLEKRLGTTLLVRTTRQVSPTAQGEEFYRRCLFIVAEVEEAEAAAGEVLPAGHLRIDVHGTWARRFLFPTLPEFLERYPLVRLHVGEGDRLVDLFKEGVDCAIRVGERSNDSLEGRCLGYLEESTFASPGYLGRHGSPRQLNELAGHQMVGFVSSATGAVMPLKFRTPAGIQSINLPTSVTVRTASSNACMAVSGMGLMQAPRYRVMHELRSGALVEVLESHLPPPLPVHLLHPPGRDRYPRVAAFIEWASSQFARKLTEIGPAYGHVVATGATPST
ncbi:MAG: LysR family transcriptional regulator [Burkholderiaceae bacterium]